VVVVVAPVVVLLLVVVVGSAWSWYLQQAEGFFLLQSPLNLRQ
jgi:hypothetical protein